MSATEKFRELHGAAKASDSKVSALPRLTENDDTNINIIFDWGQKEFARLQAGEIGKSPAVVDVMKFVLTVKGAPAISGCADPKSPGDVRFSDIKGADREKGELYINYVYPFNFPLLYPILPKGILLYGPPGGGKTLLVRAATAELPTVAFFAPKPGELRGKYEGETEKNIQLVFSCADQIVRTSKTTKYTSAVIFIDEIDSIGGKRGEDPSMTRSVNALLQAMDGIDQLPNVSTIGATNYPWSLDDAVLRRFSSRIFIDLPSSIAMAEIIRQGIANTYAYPYLGILRSVCNKKVQRISEASEVAAALAKAFKNIELYGGRGKLTPYDIDSIVKKLSPTPDGLAIRSAIVDRRTPVSLDDARLSKRGIFGYSASDVAKVFDTAVQYASRRAVMSTSNYVLVDLQIGPRAMEIQSLFVFQPEGTSIGEPTSFMDVRSSSVTTSSFLRSECRTIPTTISGPNAMITFDLRMEDFDYAISRYPTTIDNKNYVKLLMYFAGLYDGA